MNKEVRMLVLLKMGWEEMRKVEETKVGVMLQLLRGSKEDNEISFECQDDDLFSEEEEETRVEKVKRQRGDEEDELKEEVVRGQDTGIDVYSLGGKY